MDNRNDIWLGAGLIKPRSVALSDQGLGDARGVLHRGPLGCRTMLRRRWICR